jgi:chemotaxis protein methyltransferase WspC
MNPRRLLHEATGLNISEADAERAVRERMARLGMADRSAYLQALAADELSALTELVVVPESWLFRDAGAFSAAAGFAARRLALQPGRSVRLLSLPCAGGEEPYSLAMALDMAGVAPQSVRIDAIDLSHVSIRRAMAGHYTQNAFRGADLVFRDRYFKEQAGGYQLSEAIRARVQFKQGNLFELDTTALARSYDVVFCRNLLIYFDDRATHAAAQVLRSVLADDGLLFAGYAEVPALRRHGFSALRIPGAFALEKEAPEAAPPLPPLRRARAVRPERPVHTAPHPAPEPVRASARASVKASAPERAASPAPEDVLAQARRLADSGDHGAAAQACHAWLAADPASADAYFILGLVSDCRQEAAAAAEYWRRCVYLDPRHYEALCHLALLARRNGDAHAADAYQERAARIYGRRQAQGAAA